jgi:RNA polymerase sigma factor (sigma-70 family)
MGISDGGIDGDREFPSTAWSVIVHARDAGAPDYAQQLGRLVELYWRPVYSVIRHGSGRSHDDAKDLTQDFFATVVFDRELLRVYAPERGSFRSLLRTALARFLHDVARGAGRQKRGSGKLPVSLDGISELAADPTVENLTPEQIFDSAWNQAVLTEAVARLEQRLRAGDRAAVFEVFRRYDVDGDSAEASYAEVGQEVGMTVPQVKHALREARAAFRELVTELVQGYVDDPANLTAELRSLFGA